MDSKMKQAQALRIAVAITALRHKPKDQTYDSCVLDLRSKFPLAAAGGGGGGGPPDALNLNAGEETHDGSSRGCCWRERALALERELQQLQNQYRSESLELETLRAKVKDDKEAPKAPGPSTSQQPNTNKKKSKKKGQGGSTVCASKTGDNSSSRASLLDPNLRLSTLPEVIRSPSLLIPLEALELKSSQLSHQKRKQPDQSYLLTVERALGAAAELLVAQLPPHEQQPNASSLIHALTHIVPRILSTATPLVCRRSSSTNATATKPKSGTKEKPNGSENHTNAVDRILGILVTSLLVPLVRSFAPLSNNQFSTLILSPQLPKQKRTEEATTSSSSSSSSSASVPRGRSEVTVDIRYDVLGLINSIIEKLGEIGLAQGGLLVGNIRDLVQCLMLEAIRQLESLFQDESSQGLKNLGETQPTTSHHQQPQQDHQEQEHHQHTRHHHRSGRGRLAKVARKDSLWFLCSIIHLLLSSSTTLSGCSSLSDPPDLEEGTNDLLLGEAICTALSGMLRRVRDQDSCQTIDGDEDWEDAGRVGSEFWRRYGVIDEVERGMILAIIEKAALGG